MGNETSAWRAKALEWFPAMRTEIQAAESIGQLWIELIARLQSHYREESPSESSELVRGVCMYAIWCTRSESQRIREAAFIEFYGYFPKFALQCPETVYRQILADLISNIGVIEVEKMGAALAQSDLNRFLADAHQADDGRKAKSKKR